jgi:hypothetical protein
LSELLSNSLSTAATTSKVARKNSAFGRPGLDRTNDQPIMSVRPRAVVETLGHSQISLTMDTYFLVIPALQPEAADRMEAALAGQA